jgi:hypothetical protein
VTLYEEDDKPENAERCSFATPPPAQKKNDYTLWNMFCMLPVVRLPVEGVDQHLLKYNCCSYFRSLLGAPTIEEHKALQQQKEKLEQEVEGLKKELQAREATPVTAPAA